MTLEISATGVTWRTEIPYHLCESPVFSYFEDKLKFCFVRNGQRFDLYLTNCDVIDRGDFDISVYIEKEKGTSVQIHRGVVHCSATRAFTTLSSMHLFGRYKVFASGERISLIFVFNMENIQLKCIEGVVEIVTIQTVQENEPPFLRTLCLQELSTDIENILKSTHHSDMVLECEGRCFLVHKNILSARSKVFASMLSKDERSFSISDIKASVLEQLLYFIYSGRLDTLSMGTVFDLFKASNMYLVPTLNQFCSRYIAENLSEDNVCYVLNLSEIVEDTMLQNVAEAFVAERAVFLKSATWKRFADENPALAVNVYKRFVSK